jgi:hypothetical protein
MHTFFKVALTYTILAGAIKTWQPGEIITTTDLNAALQHIHNKMVGGHGARLVDADVAAGAAIATSKLALYRFIPTGYFTMTAACAVGACAVTKNGVISSVTWGNTGRYDVVFTTPRTDATYLVNCTQYLGGAPTVNFYPCYVASKTAAGFSIQLFGGAGPAAANGLADVVVYDDN